MKSIIKFFRRGPGDACREEYEFGDVIGSGSFANVYRAKAKDEGSEWAIKQIEKSRLSEADREALGTEVEILEKLDHANVVKLRQVFDTSKYFYLVMELMHGQDLYDRVVEKEKYTEQEAAMAILQIASGLDYCHQRGVAHRDLKPENLMYASKDDSSEVKIVDFGLGKVIGEANVMFTACGTPGYVAPEILRGESYDTKVDIWSLGVILYILLCGFPPFWSENNAVMFEQIKNADFEFHSPWWDDISDGAKDLIKRMLVVEPTARYSAADVMEHEWVKGGAKGASKDLTEAQAKLRKLRIKERLRAGVRAIGAMAAMKKLLGKPSSAEDLFRVGADAASAAAAAAEKGEDPEAAAIASAEAGAPSPSPSASASASAAGPPADG